VDEAAEQDRPFDYVLLCVKAVPDIYDLAAIVEPVVAPSHTCIVVNTTTSIGVEHALESAFPKNLVLSLVVLGKLEQNGPADFEQIGDTSIWLGICSNTEIIPAKVQQDISESFALTLESGDVVCRISQNIRQQQWQNLIGPIAFHPVSVLLEEPSHSNLLAKPLVNRMIMDIVDELLHIAQSQSCTFPSDFKQNVLDSMTSSPQSSSMMFQDFLARRPMEVQVLLANPISIARLAGIEVPHLETIYAVLHHINQVNQTRTTANVTRTSSANSTPPLAQPAVFASSPMNPQRSSAATSIRQVPSPMMRPIAALAPQPRQRARLPPRSQSEQTNRRVLPSEADGPHGDVSHRDSYGEQYDGLEEFASIAMYGDTIGSEIPTMPMQQSAPPDAYRGSRNADIAMRERELQLRQRELALREREMRTGMMNGRRAGPKYYGEDDDDGDDYYDADMPTPRMEMAPSRIVAPQMQQPPMDPSGFDMMSMTSRRNKRFPSMQNLRMTPSASGMDFIPRSQPSRNTGRPRMAKDRSMAADYIPRNHTSIYEDPMIAATSNRYPTVDTKTLTDNSRANSLTAQSFNDAASFAHSNYGGAPQPHMNGHMQQYGGGYQPAYSRREYQQHYDPRGGHGYPPAVGRVQPMYGQPPTIVREPMARYPTDDRIQQLQQGPPKPSQHRMDANGKKGHRSLTGSASASAESRSNESGSGNMGDGSGHSSSSSLDKGPVVNGI